MGLIQMGVGLAPVPSTDRVNHPIEPEGFPRPIHFGDGFDTLGGDPSPRLGFAPNPAFVLHQIANRGQVQHRLQGHQGETEVFLNVAIASGDGFTLRGRGTLSLA